MAKKPFITEEAPKMEPAPEVTTTEETTLETPHTVQEGESIQAEGVEGDLPVGTVIEAPKMEPAPVPEVTKEEVNVGEILSNVKDAILAAMGSRARMIVDETSIILAVDPQEITTLNKIVEVVGKGAVTGTLDIVKLVYSIRMVG